MKSMTGHGRGECARDGFKITVELSSVNRKQAEVSVALPREMEMLEAQIRDAIHRAVARGRVEVNELSAKPGRELKLGEKVVGRVSFFVNAGVRFVEEMCKMRAFVELWDEITRERYGVTDAKARRLRYGVQVNSLGLPVGPVEIVHVAITQAKAMADAAKATMRLNDQFLGQNGIEKIE